MYKVNREKEGGIKMNMGPHWSGGLNSEKPGDPGRRKPHLSRV